MNIKYIKYLINTIDEQEKKRDSLIKTIKVFRELLIEEVYK